MIDAYLKEIARVERKIDQLSIKLDTIINSLDIQLDKSYMAIKKVSRKGKGCNKLQQETRMDKIFSDCLANSHLRNTTGRRLQKEFNLLVTPSANRIHQFLESNDPGVFAGLRKRPIQ